MECAEGDDFLIDRMAECDIRQAAALEATVFSMPWSEQGFSDALSQKDNIFLVARMQDGKIAGYCGLYAAADEGEITNVAVEDSLRGCGIGFSLVENMKQRAKVQGIARVFLEVRVSNERARHLYEKAGFTVCGTRRNFYQKPVEDAHVMCCEL